MPNTRMRIRRSHFRSRTRGSFDSAARPSCVQVYRALFSCRAGNPIQRLSNARVSGAFGLGVCRGTGSPGRVDRDRIRRRSVGDLAKCGAEMDRKFRPCRLKILWKVPRPADQTPYHILRRNPTKRWRGLWLEGSAHHDLARTRRHRGNSPRRLGAYSRDGPFGAPLPSRSAPLARRGIGDLR